MTQPQYNHEEKMAQLQAAYEEFLRGMANLRRRRLEYMKKAFNELDTAQVAQIKAQLE